VTFKTGIGTELKDRDSLGKNRFTFPDYEKIHVMTSVKEGFWTKPITQTKELFLKLLPKRERIMESHVNLSLIYYYVAVQASQRRLEQSIINLIIALEALLIKEGDKIRGCLATRVAALVAENEEQRTLIAKQMKELYDLRSHIVHGRGKKPSFNDTKQLFNYTRKSLEKTLYLEALSKEELIGKIG
jgi:hypothetical protein